MSRNYYVEPRSYGTRRDTEPPRYVRRLDKTGIERATDRWRNAELRDPTGRSGNWVGQEFDIRSRYKLTPRVDTTLGYAFYNPGTFPRKVEGGRSSASNFFYIEVSVNAFAAS